MALSDFIKKTKTKKDDKVYNFGRKFVRALPGATRKVLGDFKRGNIGRSGARSLGQTNYFKPTSKVRTRDFVRELPVGIETTAKSVAQDTARFGLSVAELPGIVKTGKASGKFHNTPFGRINSFQSEAQNRVKRGDPLWKAIGNPVLDTLFAGADIGIVAKPALNALKVAKTKFIPKEVKDIASDFSQPLTQKKQVQQTRVRRTEPVPGVFAPGGVPQRRVLNKPIVQKRTKTVTRPTPFTSILMRGASRPGLTTRAVKGPTNRNTRRINAHKKKSQTEALEKVMAMKKGVKSNVQNGDLVAVNHLDMDTPSKVRNIEFDEVTTPLKQKSATKRPQSVVALEKFADDLDVKPQRPKSVVQLEKIASNKNTKPQTAEEFFGEEAPKKYDKFQKRAYEITKDRSRNVQNILKVPAVRGFSKKEMEVMRVDDAKKVATLARLGHPRKHIDKLMGDRDRFNRYVNNKVSYNDHLDYAKRKKELETHILDDIDLTNKKDIGFLMPGWRDAHRNIRQFFGSDAAKVDERLLKPFDEAKGAMYVEQKELLADLSQNVVKKFGIKAGSKESRLVQRFGEKNMTLEELQKALPNDWEKVVESEKFFRSRYDRLIDDLNKVIGYYFPTHPAFPETSKLIPKRKDYFHHMQDGSIDIDKILNLFAGPSGIDPRLVGVSEFTKPLSRWNPFAQQRKGEKTVEDAVGNYVNYVRLYGYAKHIDPHIKNFRGIDTEMQNTARATGRHAEKYSGMLEELNSKKSLLNKIARTENVENITDLLKKVDGVTDDIAQGIAPRIQHLDNTEKINNVIEKALREHPVALKGYQEYTPLKTGQADRFVQFMQDFAGDLAGKTPSADRDNLKQYNRAAMHIANGFNSRVKSNTLMGNLGSSLAQIFNVPNGVADAGVVASAKAVPKSFQSIFDNNAPIQKSSFIRERYFNEYSKFTPAFLNGEDKILRNIGGKYRATRETVRNKLAWLLGVLDEAGTRYIWHAEYQKALAKKIKDPIRYADNRTRSMVAGRGIGEVPLSQKSAKIKFIAPFQLEVANQWHVFRDWSKEPEKVRLIAVYMATSHLFNEASRHIRGSDVSFDPVNALLEGYDAYEEEGGGVPGALRAGGRVAGEVISNVPFGQQFAYAYPEFGGDIPGTNISLPRRKQFFGEGDPTRFGAGVLALKGVNDPISKILFPYGGSQGKKTLQATEALLDGAVKTRSGRIMYPTPESSVGKAQTLIFGKYSTPEAREYFDKKTTPLSPKQTQQVELGNTQKERRSMYNTIMQTRANNRENKKLRESLESGTLGNESVGGRSVLDRLLGRKAKESRSMVDSVASAYGFDVFMDKSQRPQGIKGGIWDKNKKTKARELFSDEKYDNIDDAVKENIWTSMGYTMDDVEVMYLGSMKRTAGNAAVAPYIWEKLDGAEDYSSMVNKMLDEKILTEPLLKEMYAQGFVDSDDYGPLIRAIKNGGADGTDKKTNSTKKKKVSSSKKAKKKKTTALKGTDVLEKYFADALTSRARRRKTLRITRPSRRGGVAVKKYKRLPKLVRQSLKNVKV